jgi:hypothetical protein
LGGVLHLFPCGQGHGLSRCQCPRGCQLATVSLLCCNHRIVLGVITIYLNPSLIRVVSGLSCSFSMSLSCLVGWGLLAHFFTLQSDLIIKKSAMEKWLIQGENAPNCDGQVSSPFKLVRANLRGGVPRYLSAGFGSDFLQNKHKNSSQLVLDSVKPRPRR